MTEELIADRYVVVSTLAVRDAATTRLCTDQRTGKQVVVKTLSLRQAQSQQDVELFEREGRVLRGLDLPHVPRFVDSFTEERGDDVRLHLVQEHVAGRSLLAAVREGRRFSAEDAARLGLALCETLAKIHNLTPALVHRDVKPANVVLDDHGAPWLVDFGAVKTGPGSNGPRGQTIVGTYGYMAPELYEGRSGPSSDVFALGMTLWFLLSHKEPWEFDDAGPRAALRDARNVPAALQSALLDATMPDAADRTQDAQAFARALQRFLDGTGDVKPARAAVPVPVPTTTTTTTRWPLVIAVLGITSFMLLLGGIGIASAVLGRARSTPPEVEVVVARRDPPPVKPTGPEMMFGDPALQGAIECLDRATHRAFYSRGRYLTWADAARGPTCKERYVQYGMYSGYLDAIEYCKKAADEAAARGVEPTLARALSSMAAATAELLPLLEEGSRYYDDEDYKDDGCAKGQALHPRLMAGWDRLRAAVTTLESEVDRLQAAHFSRVRRGTGGDPALTYAIDTLDAVRRVALAAPAWWDAKEPRAYDLTPALDALRAAHQSTLEALKTQPPTHLAALMTKELDDYFVEMKKLARELRESGAKQRHDDYGHYDPYKLRVPAREALSEAYDEEQSARR